MTWLKPHEGRVVYYLVLQLQLEQLDPHQEHDVRRLVVVGPVGDVLQHNASS